MNYLAHIFLSGSDKQIQLGNFIGDAVKGRSYNNFPQRISEGILLHRAIDTYTDNHPTVKKTIQLLKPYFGRYSGILLDIYFDYFLASRFSEYSKISLKRYTKYFYFNMISHRRYLPDRIKGFMWHFIGTDRLYKYAFKDGIRKSLDIMVVYRHVDIPVDKAINFLTEYEKELWSIFQLFFCELQELCYGYIGAENRTEYLKQCNKII
jgi:acyl carrier protein phosphodiesterase